MNNQIYPTDITDSQWDYIKELIPAAKRGGRPRSLDMRQVINAILYVTVSGIQWRMLPKEYPKWKSVYHYFRLWRKEGIWKRIHDTLRARERQRNGRHKHATAGSLDSQSVKRSAIGGQHGYDAGKKIDGRKRHILVDTLGLLIAVMVTGHLSPIQLVHVSYCVRWMAPARNCVSSGSTAPIEARFWTGLRTVFASAFLQSCDPLAQKASSFYPSGGPLSAHSPGWSCIAVSLVISRRCLKPARRSFRLP